MTFALSSAIAVVGRRPATIAFRAVPHGTSGCTSGITYLKYSCANTNTSRRSVSTLILLRHGQSMWNGPNARFTGWCDIPLTVRGRVEAVAAGQLMRSRGFKASKVCVAFASELQRSHETCELALASMAGHEQETWSSERIRRDWRLNERH